MTLGGCATRWWRACCTGTPCASASKACSASRSTSPGCGAHYFPEVARQVARIGGSERDAAARRARRSGRPCRRARRQPLAGADRAPEFPLAFFDPRSSPRAAPDLPRETWEAVAGAGADPTLGDARAGRQPDAGGAASPRSVLVLGRRRDGAGHAGTRPPRRPAIRLRLDGHARAQDAHRQPSARPATRWRADACRGPDALKEYAQLVVQESKRLTRLVDNLLAYARITDVDRGLRVRRPRLARAPRRRRRTGFRDDARRRRFRRARWRCRRTSPPSAATAPRACCCSTTSSTTRSATRQREHGSRSVPGPPDVRVVIEVARPRHGHPGRRAGARDAAGSSGAARRVRRQRPRPGHRQPHRAGPRRVAVRSTSDGGRGHDASAVTLPCASEADDMKKRGTGR